MAINKQINISMSWKITSIAGSGSLWLLEFCTETFQEIGDASFPVTIMGFLCVKYGSSTEYCCHTDL